MIPRMSENGYAGSEPGFHNMIILSVIAHLIVITIVLVSVPTASRHLTFGPVYSVQLVSPDIILSRERKSSLLEEIEKSGAPASAVIFKKDINRSAAAVVKKDETDRLNITKAINAIKQKQLKTLQQPSSKTNSGNRAASMTSGETNTKINEYADFVSARIHNNWSIPPELKPSGNIETIIEIKIMRNGTLLYAGFEKRSGNHFYDDSALKAVKKSAPFPSLPEDYPDNIMEIGIRFYPSQLR